MVTARIMFVKGMKNDLVAVSDDGSFHVITHAFIWRPSKDDIS